MCRIKTSCYCPHCFVSLCSDRSNRKCKSRFHENRDLVNLEPNADDENRAHSPRNRSNVIRPTIRHEADSPVAPPEGAASTSVRLSNSIDINSPIASNMFQCHDYCIICH